MGVDRLDVLLARTILATMERRAISYPAGVLQNFFGTRMPRSKALDIRHADFAVKVVSILDTDLGFLRLGKNHSEAPHRSLRGSGAIVAFGEESTTGRCRLLLTKVFFKKTSFTAR